MTRPGRSVLLHEYLSYCTTFLIRQALSFELQIGSSSRDIRLRQAFAFGKGRHASNVPKTSYHPIIDGTLSAVDDSMFSRRLVEKASTDVPEEIVDRNNQSLRIFNRNSLLKEATASQ